MAFGENLKRLRTNKKLTQSQLAEIMNMSKSSISYYENGNKMPSPDVLTKFSHFFEVSIDVLMGTNKPLFGQSIDVSGLTAKEIEAIENIVDIMRNRKE